MDCKQLKRNILLILLGGLVGGAVFAQEDLLTIPTTRSVLINNGDSLIEASILVDKNTKLKLDDQKFYAWYAFEKIHENQGAYSGQLLHGDYKVFNHKDQLIKQGQYVKGLKSGMWRSWDEQGRKLKEDRYKEGVLDGLSIRYHQGRVIYQAQYESGLLDGRMLIYDENGTYQEKRYKDGVLKEPDEDIKKDSWYARWKARRDQRKAERSKAVNKNQAEKKASSTESNDKE